MKDNLIKHKTKIISAFIIILALAIAFMCGGKKPSDKQTSSEHISSNSASPSPRPHRTARPILGYTETPSPNTEEPKKEKTQKKETPSATPKTSSTPVHTKEKKANKTTSAPTQKDIDYSEQNGMSFDSSTGQDKYHTDPVPEGEPIPVEPQEVVIFEDREHTCTLSVRCDTILNNLDLLPSEKHSLVPSDGIIYKEHSVVFSEGESVFDVTLREMKNNRIHFEFTKTPIYNSAYIEGINNLYEFDCGELSGWQYKVNGWFPNYGCSRYQVHDGDKIEWIYTCDMGEDIGGFNTEAQQ